MASAWLLLQDAFIFLIETFYTIIKTDTFHKGLLKVKCCQACFIIYRFDLKTFFAADVNHLFIVG